MPLISFNGKILDREDPILPVSSRAVRYGDGLFESMRLVKGKPVFFDDHMARLQEGLAALKLTLPVTYSDEWFAAQLTTLAQENNLEAARVRLIVYRAGEGTYAPEGMEAGVIMEMLPLEDEQLPLNEKGLAIDVFDEGIYKSADKLANFKTLNSLVYIMAAIHEQEKGVDDCLVLNHEKVVCDATSSNVFIVKDGILGTPSLSAGCVDGIMRRQVIKIAAEAGVQVAAFRMGVDDVLSAREVFLTNATSGIRWVEKFRDSTYVADMAPQILEEINGLAG